MVELILFLSLMSRNCTKAVFCCCFLLFFYFKNFMQNCILRNLAGSIILVVRVLL